MGWHDPFRIIPRPTEVVVHARQKPSLPFGFRKGTGIEWQAQVERRVRDAETVEWARRQREGD